ncbi:uncharacterized protein LAJ45_08233 [Morchella importuna]|uniref:uncharacterized protein n=1 Tax=Morchella importuna TaxID=1174673 RepID=UPI001E8D5E49|nr:uncharacterized protein LAJ45_08233 [Morchella importuna]KAH8147767.1 hypothetical protein LAJ45_08233 [Morchella importuna]
MVERQLPPQRAQSQSSPFHRVISSGDPETRLMGQWGGSVRDDYGLPQVLPTSSTSTYPLSTTSAVHATSASSVPAPPVPAPPAIITSNGEMEPACQLVVKNTHEESVHSFGTKVKDYGQQDVLEDKSEHETDGGVSESGWTTASGGMAFSFSFVDGKPFAQPIFNPNGTPFKPFIPIHMRPPVKSPNTMVRNKSSLVNSSTNDLKSVNSQNLIKNKKEEMEVVKKRAEPPTQSVRKVPDTSTKSSSALSGAERQRTYCELYNAHVETMFAGISSKYPQPTSASAAKEARQAELDAKRAAAAADFASSPTSIMAKEVPTGRDNEHKAFESGDDSGVPPNWEACEPDPSTRPNSTNGWINWKPKPKTGPASARSGHMTMSEYQAAIAYRPQGVDREYEAAKERAAAKRFSGPQYQYYNEQSHKKRRPKNSPRKTQQQNSSLPPMFPDILPWRDVVPQPLNVTGKKMPKLDFCGEPIEKGRGFDGTIKHWGVPTKNQDHVPFLEINAIASEYTTDCDKDTDDPTRKSVRRFPPPKSCSVSKYPTDAQIKDDYLQDNSTTSLKKEQEMAEALESSSPLPRLLDSFFEQNPFTLRERIGTFINSLNPDFPDPPDMPYEKHGDKPVATCVKRRQPSDELDTNEIIIDCVEDELEKPRREPHMEPIKGRADMEWYRTHDGCWSQRVPLPKKTLPPLPPNEPANDW